MMATMEDGNNVYTSLSMAMVQVHERDHPCAGRSPYAREGIGKNHKGIVNSTRGKKDIGSSLHKVPG